MCQILVRLIKFDYLIDLLFSFLLCMIVSVAIHWNPNECTTSNVEDFVSIIDPFICLREVDRNHNLIVRSHFYIYSYFPT